MAGGNSSSSLTKRGVRPCSQEYCAAVSSTLRLACTPCWTTGGPCPIPGAAGRAPDDIPRLPCAPFPQAHSRPEFHVARMHVVFVLQIAARPERGGLLIFRHAHLLALEIGGLVDAAILAHQDADLEHAAGCEDRNADPAVVAPGDRHHQRGQRHLGDVELGKPQLAPEQLGWMHAGAGKIDAVRLHLALENWPRARIVRHRDAQGQIHNRSQVTCAAG